MDHKLLLVTSEFPPLPGGIGNHAYNLAKNLVENNYKVTVITDQRSLILRDDVFFDKNQTFEIVRVRRYKISFLVYLSRCFQIFKLLLSNNFDKVLLSGKFSLWIGAFLKFFFTKKKYVAVIHGSELLAGARWSKKLTKWSLKQFDHLIAVSNFTKQLALGINSDLNIKVINNGFTPLRSATNLAKPLEGFPKLITVGNVTYRKGQQNVIKALPKMLESFPDLHYHMVGIPTEKEKFLALAQELKVEDKITFHGMLTEFELKEVVAQSDVFLMLSQQLENGDVEGFGIALIEANALGKPCIGASDSGIADAINDGFSGKLVQTDQPDQIVQALQTIMGDYELFSKNAKQWSNQFLWEKVIVEYRSILES